MITTLLTAALLSHTSATATTVPASPTVADCNALRAAVKAGKLASEVVYDPASPCYVLVSTPPVPHTGGGFNPLGIVLILVGGAVIRRAR